MRLAGDDDGASTALARRAKLRSYQKFAKLLDTNALLIIDLQKKEVSIGAPYGPRKTWSIGSSSGAPADVVDDAASDTNSDTAPVGRDATDDGRPDAGGDGADPGSSDIDISDADDSSGSDDAATNPQQDDSSQSGVVPDSGVGAVVDDDRVDD